MTDLPAIVPYDAEVTPAMHDLLLEADPDEAAVAAYLAQGQVFVCGAATTPYGVMVLLSHAPEGADIWEVKNIATVATHRGQGVGSALLAVAKSTAQAGGAQGLVIGTGNSSLDQLRLYQRNGFRICGVVPDFFANYPEPIYENGIRCRDMVRLHHPFRP